MAATGQYPKRDLYETQHAESSGYTFKPVLAGILIVAISAFYLVYNINVVFYGAWEWLSMYNPVESLFYTLGMVFLIVSIIAGFCAINRIFHRFTLMGTILGGLGAFFGLYGIYSLGGFLMAVPFILIVLSDDEFVG